MNNNKFCVYMHCRKDNNDVFYVGKGTLKRANSKIRNKYHNRIAEKYGMYVKIIKQDLNETEAYQLENKIIEDLVYNKGYSIAISGLYEPTNPHQLTNHSLGGDGGNYGNVHTEEWKKQHSIDMSGKNNPMYGINIWANYSEEKREEVKKKISKRFSGENNPMYGISPKERMSEEKYKEWLDKKSLNSKGENNPNYGNHTLHNKLLNRPDLRKEYYSRPGSQNGRARGVQMYDNNNRYIGTFDTLGDCASRLKEITGRSTSIDSMRPHISKAAKNSTPYLNHYFLFI